MHPNPPLFSLAHLPSGCAESQPDAALLALAPAFEAAVREYEAFLPIAMQVEPGDPAAKAIGERDKALYRARGDVVRQILDARPATHDGLLLIAHAVAVAKDYVWDDPEDPLDEDEIRIRIRTLCDQVFRLAGIDWRGRPRPGAEAAPPSSAHPDAALLALGREFDAKAAVSLESVPASNEAAEAAAALLKSSKATTYEQVSAAYEAAWSQPGQEASIRESDAFEALTAFFDPIMAETARTVEGLAVKARAIAAFNWPNGSFEQDAGSEDEKHSSYPQIRDLIEATCALAGVDWRGRPVPAPAPAATPGEAAAPDPVHAFIAAHRATYAECDRLNGIAGEMLHSDPRHEAALAADRARRREEMRAEYRLDELAAVVQGPSVAAPAGDPIFAAIEASRAALAEHVAACNAPDADTPAGDARRTAAGEANTEAWTALKATPPRTVAGALALARYLPSFVKDGPWDDTEDAAALFSAIGTVESAGPEGEPGSARRQEIAPDPVFAAIEAHRSAHAAWLAGLERDDEAETAAAMGRKEAAFTALLAMQPLSEAGRLAYAGQVLFEFAHTAIGSVVPPEWMRIAGRMMNRGQPIVTASQAPSAFGHAAGEAVLRALEDALAPHLALPAPGSPEALARFKAASRAVDHAACLGEAEDRALRIGEGFTYWTSDRINAAQLGDWSRFSIGELEVARNRTKAELDELMVLALRRELRMAEAVRDTQVRKLYALAFPEIGAEAGAAPAEDVAEPAATSLTAAAAELIRLDRAIKERLGVEEKARDEAWQAGIEALEEARRAILETLNETPSRTLADLQAKAGALRKRELTEEFERHGDLALSLAEDIERLTGSGSFAPEPAQAFPLAAE